MGSKDSSSNNPFVHLEQTLEIDGVPYKYYDLRQLGIQYGINKIMCAYNIHK